MLDLLGREVNRGDIIVYGHVTGKNFLKFAESKIGVIVNVIPKGREYTIRNNTHNHKQKTYADKACFHSIDKVNMIGSKRYKNGKPNIGNVVLTTQCIKLNIEDLDTKMRSAYDVFKLEFQL